MANADEKNKDEEDSNKSFAKFEKGSGSTPSEKYLSTLCEDTFLDLWSYPNVFTDRGLKGKGDGKEMCDLLVVCGDHIIIFSDKSIAWPEGNDEVLSWARWYKRAIDKSVDQIRGAERWLAQFPDRIYIDRKCQNRLPLELPPIDRRRVHGIVVALGAGEACRRYFGHGIGSLMIAPRIKGREHFDDSSVLPFVVGDIAPDGSFAHVLDDATLSIALKELDTISDFTAYLTKKRD